MTFSERLCPSRGLNLGSTEQTPTSTVSGRRSSLRVTGDRHDLDDTLPREWGRDTPPKIVAPSAKTKSVNHIRDDSQCGGGRPKAKNTVNAVKAVADEGDAT
jgi:hypothetical protein